MEALFLYLAKVSLLLSLFYLAYHFLVRKETFFEANRCFLLSGLATSIVLPLYYIKRIVFIEQPKISLEEIKSLSQITYRNNTTFPVEQAIDWWQILGITYGLVVALFFIQIIVDLASLYKMINKQQYIKNEKFKLINIKQNIAPFSFFNLIVYNAALYTHEELQSIILHEKVHSRDRHSIDVLLIKILCAILWFNPFIWLYKKAIIQNLEYIADQKAIQQLENRYAYQHALLKVVSHQNCLSITNHFYQSLIKKRIVMLNKNQSHKRNSWKYALVIPALVGFVLLFQIKVIAQEKEEDAFVKTFAKGFHSGDEIHVKIDKNSSDEQLKKEVARLKLEHGISLKISKVKRNAAGQITCIKVAYKDQNGHNGVNHVEGDEPINPIIFYKNESSIGFGETKKMSVYTYVNKDYDLWTKDLNNDSNDSLQKMKNFDINIEIPEVSESPEALEAPEIAEIDEAINPSEVVDMNDKISKVIVRKNGDKTLVIINGKVITDDKTIQETMKNLYIVDNSSSSDEDPNEIIINSQNIAKIKADAIKNANNSSIRKQPIIKKQIRIANGNWKKVKEELDKAKSEVDASKPEMDKAKAEMIKAKEEMIRAKEELLKAKAELDKERANLKKKNKK
jgi:hypothetical protein